MHRQKQGMIIEITDQDFGREVMQCKLPVFVYFVAPWCHTCYPTRLFAEELAEEYYGRVKLVKIDIEESPEVAERYHVIAVPTVLLFRDSREVKRLLGFQDRRSLRSLLNGATAEEGMLIEGTVAKSRRI